MAKPEVAFASYAQFNNRDRYLREFMDELRGEVAERADVPIEDVLFFDSDGIKTGQDWVKRLSAAICGCKVLVAICSPSFINSQFCGKEVRIFLDRLQRWEQLPENRNKPSQSIIAVLWIKTDMPDVLARFQYKDAPFPREYVEEDLRTLCRLNSLAEQRTKVINVLAKRILEAAREDLPSLDAIPAFDNIDSAFLSEKPAGTRYGVAVVDLMKEGAPPNANGSSLAADELVAKVCGSLTAWRKVPLDQHVTKSLKAAQKNREAILIVADLPTLTAPLWKKSVELIDAAGGVQTALVIAGTAEYAAPEAGRQAQITLKGLFPNSFDNYWEYAVDASGKADLQQTLSERITKLRDRLVGEDEGIPATDQALVAAASANGISLHQQPILGGPGGRR